MIAGLTGDRGERTPNAAYMYPVVVDLDAGTVTVEKRTKGLYGKLRDSYDRIARENEPRLQVALDTGVVPANTHRYYLEAANAIAQLERTPPASEPSSPTYSEPFATPGGGRDRSPSIMNYIVPPGGFAGFAQQTIANQRALGTRVGAGGGTRKRRKKKTVAKKRASPRRAKKGGKLKKGSAAAKAYMAKIRKKRR